MGIERPNSADAAVEQVEEPKTADRRPPPPPDRPGQEPEGVPSRLESRRALAVVKEQEAGKPADATDEDMPQATSEQGSRVAERRPEPPTGSRIPETSEDTDEHRSSDQPYDAGGDQPGSPVRARTETPTWLPVERADRPHEVKTPQMVGDYYTNIPPTAQDRYLVRDPSNPVPVFDGPPARHQVAQGVVGDCGIVATLGAAAEHRPDAIKNGIHQIDDGEYEITLHEITKATPADPVSRPTGNVTTYRVNDELPVVTDDPSRQPAGIQAEKCGWPALIEKVIAAEDQTWDTAETSHWDQAWTTRHKPAVDQDRASAGLGPSPDDAPMGYNRLDIGSTAYQRADLLAKLTGEAAEVRRIPGEHQGEQALLDEFRDQLSDGNPILVGTRGNHIPNERFPNSLVPGHAYEVTKVENDSIHMRNPWGRRHPAPIDTKTFWEYCRQYNYDGTRDGHYTTLK